MTSFNVHWLKLTICISASLCLRHCVWVAVFGSPCLVCIVSGFSNHSNFLLAILLKIDQTVQTCDKVQLCQCMSAGLRGAVQVVSLFAQFSHSFYMESKSEPFIVLFQFDHCNTNTVKMRPMSTSNWDVFEDHSFPFAGSAQLPGQLHI